MTSISNFHSVKSQLNKPVLTQGSSGQAVLELQKLLKHWRCYCGEIDGIFGPQTTAAVNCFEYWMFLAEDGIVDENTWLSLYKGAPVDMPVLQKRSQGELVEKIQERLLWSGFFQSAITGYFGIVTENAIKDLQQRTGLAPDGIVGDRTWLELSKIREYSY
ncbi:putative peptidoglycan-binding domain-containing protein [Rivularia sp. PCC 7116]|uniref:peptidoglycan-binding domain-containing protein n=1 Tax=Rivularia sp. PCC 7116 TaxID=373994 RepID=UPI00029F04A4|nr:peptidoglycan-binding protein [Rivularia sp. PCC 7116]AFY52669.1 putative peptidoglycan-binding domain-containing protein [Rivularia sp. PCC 7116]